MWNKKENRFYRAILQTPKINIGGITSIFTENAHTAWGACASGLIEYDIDHHTMLKVYAPDSTDVAYRHYHWRHRTIQ
jgi:hypothetical protein